MKGLDQIVWEGAPRRNERRPPRRRFRRMKRAGTWVAHIIVSLLGATLFGAAVGVEFGGSFRSWVTMVAGVIAFAVALRAMLPHVDPTPPFP